MESYQIAAVRIDVASSHSCAWSLLIVITTSHLCDHHYYCAYPNNHPIINCFVPDCLNAALTGCHFKLVLAQFKMDFNTVYFLRCFK